jgi:MSHA biogenesis protein MshN
MLQDLDARHTAANEATNLYTKPAARREAGLPVSMIAAAVTGVVALAVAGALGWHYWHKGRDEQAAQKPVKVVMLPQGAAPVKPVAPVPAAAPMPQPAPSPASPPAVEASAQAPAAKPEAPAHERARTKRAAAARKGEKENAEAPAKPRTKHKAEEKPAAKVLAGTEVATTKAKGAKASGQGKGESLDQKAEASYRRALASLQDGYVTDAIAAFEDTLKANSKHDAARQTLVSLLIENRRVDEAIRQLQLGLTLDPRQPPMAMLLARLQIERGASGIETLMRTLPYAGTNADYHAFLAGALQRQQRHREAAGQYQAALRSVPQNGVWWMGLGISLQAEKRDAEALDAFRKAKGTGLLSPELLNFVDRKIQQLGGASGA